MAICIATMVLLVCCAESEMRAEGAVCSDVKRFARVLVSGQVDNGFIFSPNFRLLGHLARVVMSSVLLVNTVSVFARVFERADHVVYRHSGARQTIPRLNTARPRRQPATPSPENHTPSESYF